MAALAGLLVTRHGDSGFRAKSESLSHGGRTMSQWQPAAADATVAATEPGNLMIRRLGAEPVRASQMDSESESFFSGFSSDDAHLHINASLDINWGKFCQVDITNL